MQWKTFSQPRYNCYYVSLPTPTVPSYRTSVRTDNKPPDNRASGLTFINWQRKTFTPIVQNNMLRKLHIQIYMCISECNLTSGVVITSVLCLNLCNARLHLKLAYLVDDLLFIFLWPLQSKNIKINYSVQIWVTDNSHVRWRVLRNFFKETHSSKRLA